MSHKPIQFHNVGISFPKKICFEELTGQIQYGNRIALIGQNGSSKSTLLKILQGYSEPTEGKIKIPVDVVFGYVSQVIEEFELLSGGQRLNKVLTQALDLNPRVLLLDEPTNNLDLETRTHVIQVLTHYPGAMIIISHDADFLKRINITHFYNINQVLKNE